MEFHREPEYGFIRKDDYNKLISACHTIGNCIYKYPSEGRTLNGVDYLPADLLEDPEDINNALNVLNSYFNYNK